MSLMLGNLPISPVGRAQSACAGYQYHPEFQGFLSYLRLKDLLFGCQP